MFEKEIGILNFNGKNIYHADNMTRQVYTVDEIQDILKISRTTAYNLVKQNQFRYVKVGGHYRISKSSFDKWLNEQQEV